jgi:hypothetical protein
MAAGCSGHYRLRTGNAAHSADPDSHTRAHSHANACTIIT